MIKTILTIFCGLLFFNGYAQNFTGQWKGQFVDRSTSYMGWGGDRCDYVLELECNGKVVTGFSFTYFTDEGKKYYTICRLEGFIKPKEKYIEVKEIERTKTNVPATVRNCFQVHKLTYYKIDNTETIEGSWNPAPNQIGDCGHGTTVLTRRTLKSLAGFKSSADIEKQKKNDIPVVKKPVTADRNKLKSVPLVKQPARPAPKSKLPDNDLSNKTDLPIKSDPVPSPPEIIESPANKFEKRNNTVLKTIEVNNKSVKVDLYDNGEVDGDSISLFYNGKLLLSNKRLSEKPISLNLNVEDDEVNELIMYAENLGTITPNTALMVVTDGPKRYEVRITSDLQKSGVINFIRKPEAAAQ